MQQGIYEARQVRISSGTFEVSCRIVRKACAMCKLKGRLKFVKELVEARNITCASTGSPVGDNFPLGKRVVHALRLTPEFNQTRCHTMASKRLLVAV